MITHKTLAALVSSLYAYVGAPVTKWLYKSDLDANVYMGIVQIEDCLVVVTRGSFNKEDWIHDLRARSIIPQGKPMFGRVHQGMYYGTPEAWDIVNFYAMANPTSSLIFTGHSLGAARANLLACHAIVDKFKPRAVVCWGEPACLFPEGGKLLAGVSGESYQNMVDFQVDPVTMSTVLFGYQSRQPLKRVSMRPTENFTDMFRLHHFKYYEATTPETQI